MSNELSKEKVGSVLVVGSGIAGMQSALDCANAGFKVYLLERQPSIGGNMARLDKTFPTNDCAMCMISPKLVEVGRHLNIQIISYADLESVEGEPGNFTVTINKRARFIDETKCNGCGDCERECPVHMKDSFNGNLSDRKAIYRLYPQAIPNVFTIDKRDLPPPCRATCPAGVNAQGYIALISKGNFLEALDLVRERMPFAGACGRICHHPCEQKCNRIKIDEAVSVRNLKRFVADFERDLIGRGQSTDRKPREGIVKHPVRRRESVAVVGGGPAGLTCAIDLDRKGFPVTVFDANEKLGGMMRTGIPAYRLPRDFLDHEIGLVVGTGIKTRLGTRLGRDFAIGDLKEQGFGAIFIATGAQLPKRIPLQGSEARGILYGIPFLREVNDNGTPDIGRKVVVIGGGNVAMDVARSAMRLLGAKGSVSLFCLESEPEMPAHAWEIREAKEEGIELNPGWGPNRVISEAGKVTGIEFAHCASVFDNQGKFNPVIDRSSLRTIDADSVILAVGQACDTSFLDAAVHVERGLIVADPLTLATSVDGIFAGGDIVLGPASLVQAVAQGHRAAESISRYLDGIDPGLGRDPVERPDRLADIPALADTSAIPRACMPIAAARERTGSFLEIDKGFSPEMAVAEAKRCLNCGGCSVCRECVRVCKAGAVSHEMSDTIRTVSVGAIIMATGHDVFDPVQKPEYGLGRYANVVTSVQFERILSASGPYSGHLRRPGDGKTPRKIAWIQCVGSRDMTAHNDYCSYVCCTQAVKQAIVAVEHERSVEATVFYIDMRCFGKGFESFFNRARDAYGVRFIRSQISSVKEDPVTGSLQLCYVGQTNNRSSVIEEEFDIVVLSVGLVPSPSARHTAALLGVECNQRGFVRDGQASPTQTSREGIYVCGTASGPRDIPETVMQGSAAAALVGELLHSVRGTRVTIKEYPEEKMIDKEEARIGVFICHCGINIASVVDVAGVTEYVKTLPGVAHAEHNLYTCSQDAQKKIKELIAGKNLNRVIVASCTPRTHEPLFQETIREAGLNKFLFEMADIREQCSWVHQKEPESATRKAQALVRGSVAKSRLLEPLEFKTVGVTRSVLVIGGGMAGMTAALSLARQGFPVYLVEKEGQLGGNLVHVTRSLEGHSWQESLRQTIAQVHGHDRIQVMTDCRVDTVGGFVGNFITNVTGRTPAEIRHGAVVIATGAGEFTPGDFLYGKSARVITQRGLERKIEEGFNPADVVMIQCVGSRCAERQYCSRVCCGEAVKNAIALKEKHPDTRIRILYREIRTYGLREEYYRKARSMGIGFIHFPDDRYPVVDERGTGLLVRVYDTVLDREIELPADTIVLSAATVADREANDRLSQLLKIPLNEDGFFMEAHIKLRPVDFANEGIFVCGLAHSPKYTEENITQALAAAGRVACILSKDTLEVGGVISVVDQDRCATCLTCVRECVYNAPFINSEGKAEIESVKCQGCGNCAAACPAKAIQLRTFTDSQERELFTSILREPQQVLR